MSIGRMIDPVLNEPRNPWYQKRNHVRIPSIGESKKYIDAHWTGQGGGEGVAPVNQTTPTISSADVPLIGATLTRVNGTWTGTPAPSVVRRWQRNGADIPGATGATYTLVADDAGAAIRLRETATNASGTVTVYSNVLYADLLPPTALWTVDGFLVDPYTLPNETSIVSIASLAGASSRSFAGVGSASPETAEVAGIRGIAFDGSNYLNGVGAALPNRDRPSEVYLIGHLWLPPVADIVEMDWIGTVVDANNRIRLRFLVENDNGAYMCSILSALNPSSNSFRWTARYLTTVNPLTGGWVCIEAQHTIVAQGTNQQNATVWENGVDIGSHDYNVTAAEGVATGDSDLFTLGARPNSGGPDSYFTGVVGRCGLLYRVPSEGERDTIREWVTHVPGTAP